MNGWPLRESTLSGTRRCTEGLDQSQGSDEGLGFCGADADFPDLIHPAVLSNATNLRVDLGSSDLQIYTLRD